MDDLREVVKNNREIIKERIIRATTDQLRHGRIPWHYEVMINESTFEIKTCPIFDIKCGVSGWRTIYMCNGFIKGVGFFKPQTTECTEERLIEIHDFLKDVNFYITDDLKIMLVSPLVTVDLLKISEA